MARQSVQSGYFEAPLAGFPGQIADFGTSTDNAVRGFPAETELVAGLGNVKGAAIDLDADANPLNQPAPYQLKAPLVGSVDADFVGITIRTEACTNSANDEAAYAAGAMASSTFKRGDGAIVYVKTNLAVVADDDVYMSINAGAAPNLPVGEFTNAAGAGVIQITGIKWHASAPANSIGRIEL
jgi:hypothetical protein